MKQSNIGPQNINIQFSNSQVQREQTHPQPQLVMSPIFDRLLQKYHDKIINGMNSDAHVYMANLGILLSDTKPGSVRFWSFDHMYNCTNRLSLNGKFTNLAEVVLMCTKSLLKCNDGLIQGGLPDDLNTSFMKQMYDSTGSKVSETPDMIGVLREIGLTVIRSKALLHVSENSVDFGGERDNAQHVWENSYLGKKSNWDELVKRYKEYVNGNRFLGKLGWSTDRPYLDYLRALHNSVSNFLSQDVMDELYTLDKDGVNGSMFFVTLALNLNEDDGHANVMRFMMMNKVIEVYVFEPHGHASTLMDLNNWHNAALHFGELVTITLQRIKMRHKIIIGEQTCPRLQKNLPLCAMYAMYFAVLNHVLPRFGVQTGFHAIADLCNLEGSRYAQGSRISHMRTQILDSDGGPIQPEHTCTHDLVIMMLIGFYGIGGRRLIIRDQYLDRFIQNRPEIQMQVVQNESMQAWDKRFDIQYRIDTQAFNKVIAQAQAYAEAHPINASSIVSENALIHQRTQVKTLANLFEDKRTLKDTLRLHRLHG